MSDILFDQNLSIYAESLDDIEEIRIAAENRLRQLTRNEADSDGENRGFGLTLDHPSVKDQALIVDGLKTLEKQAVKNLEKAMKNHPLGPWVANQKGLGNKTIARVLASIGDPYWNTLHDRPRTVSELWAYCGLSVINGQGQRRLKGVQSNWNAIAKVRLYNVVDPIVKCKGSPYRDLYDQYKESLQGSTYSESYTGQKFKGEPIYAGQLLSKGHIESRTRRKVMKEILKDLWIESKMIHEKAVVKQLISV